MTTSAKEVLHEYALHAHSNRFKQRLELTRHFVEQAFFLSGSNRWTLSLSFGKDSVALLIFLVTEFLPELQSVSMTSSETLLVNNFLGVIEALKTQGYLKNLHLIQTDHADIFSGDATNLNWDATRAGIVHHQDNWLLDEWSAKNGFVGSFIGLRKQESQTRKVALNSNSGYGSRSEGYCHKMKNPLARGLWHACPLAEWRLEDLGAYLYTHDAPLLQTYIDYGLASRTVGRVNDRISVSNAGQNTNSLAMLKASDPERYNRLLNLFPDLSTKL